MTDKQIIIDGIPVQDCCYFDYENDGYKDSCYIHQNECSAQNCYYKQLKRKEQECEGLKEEIKNHNDDMFKNPPEKRFYCKGCTLPYISKKLKAENKIFKETLDDLFKVQYKLADNNKKLRQCLTEIKEIAEKCCINQATLDCENYDNCEECGRISDGDGIQQILQKISECEVK